MQDLGQTDPAKMKQGIREFQMALARHFKLWSVSGVRQIDYSSCFTDALVVLKDALQCASFKALVSPKVKSVELGVTLFYLPEILLKTAQIASLPVRSLADLDQMVRSGVSLREFRKAHDVPVMLNGQSKQFGAFTLFKVQKLAVNVERMALADTLVESVFRQALEL